MGTKLTLTNLLNKNIIRSDCNCKMCFNETYTILENMFGIDKLFITYDTSTFQSCPIVRDKQEYYEYKRNKNREEAS